MSRFLDYVQLSTVPDTAAFVVLDQDDPSMSADGTTKYMLAATFLQNIYSTANTWGAAQQFNDNTTFAQNANFLSTVTVSGTVSCGATVAHADPTAPTHSVNLQYADANYAPLVGVKEILSVLSTSLAGQVDSVALQALIDDL